MRVVFLGSPPYATPILKRLFDSPFAPEAVVTQPTRRSGRGRKAAPQPVVELVEVQRDAGREVELFQPEKASDAEFRKRLWALEPDLLLVASYGELLDQELLDLPPMGCLNVHASLLPRHRGASPVQAAILAGDAETGVSIQRMVLKLDAGDVLLEERLAIGERETAGELFNRLADLGAECAVRALELVERGAATYTPQDPAGVTRCRKLKKQHGRLDWAQDVAAIDRRVRAMTPWPSAWTTLPGGRVLTVLAGAPIPVHSNPAPGALGTELSEGRLVIGCADGAFEAHSVKPAGKGAMPSADFLRGAQLEAGHVLGLEDPA